MNFLKALHKHKNYLFLFLGIVIFLISKNNGFFWDNVLFASKMGNYLYENSIFDWTIPDNFDPGHPPFLGFLLAIFWHIFGQQLWVSHFLMLPFVIGTFYQLHKFVSFYNKDSKKQWFAFLFIIVDPTLSTQFVIVNPEIIIVFFFFLALNGLLKENKKLQFLGLFFLSIISFRGMMLFAGFFLFDVLNKIFIKKEKFKQLSDLKFLFFYLLASLPAFVFVGWRLLTKGWLQTHPDSPWSSLWQFASFKIFFKNLAVLVWRYLDFGRVFLFIFLMVSIIIFGKKIWKSYKNKQLILLSICSVLFIVIVSLLATNSFGHRYFIISFIALNLLCSNILFNRFTSKKTIFVILFLGLISGNLWIYPKQISQGWDATLAHVPYHNLRVDAIEYLHKNNINIEEVATFFPNYHPINTIDFSGDKRSFQHFNGTNKYVFYSSVYNLSDENLAILEEKYQPIQELKKLNIKIIIYIRK